MIGRALLTCDFDERWNGPPPRCESKLRPSRALCQLLISSSLPHPALQLLSATRCRATTTTQSSVHPMAPTMAPRRRSVARLDTAWRDHACSPAWRQASGAVRCHVASSWNHRHWPHQQHHHRHRHRLCQHQRQHDPRSRPAQVVHHQPIVRRAAPAAPAALQPAIRIHRIPASIRRRWRSTEKVRESRERERERES